VLLRLLALHFITACLFIASLSYDSFNVSGMKFDAACLLLPDCEGKSRKTLDFNYNCKCSSRGHLDVLFVSVSRCNNAI